MPTIAEPQFLFVHIEPDLVDASLTERPKRIRAAAAALGAGAAIVGAPATFAVTQGGTGRLIDELQPFATDATCFSAHMASALLNPNLAGALDRHRRRTLIVAGYAADVALLHTALHALAEGYRVLVPVDATGSVSDRAERAAFRRIEQAGGELTAATSLLAELSPDFSTVEGEKMLSLIEGLQTG